MAELAGTTLRTVRHYHDIGLLPLPERGTSRYKQYEVRHLVRLLRIRRYVDLGFSLPQVAAILDNDEHPTEQIRGLDERLAETIERLAQVRRELALLLHETRHAPDLPGELMAVSSHGLTDADRSFLLVIARIVSPTVLRDYIAMLRTTGQDPVLVEFTHLPADADEATRADLAARLPASVARLHLAHPALRDLTEGATVGRDTAAATIALAIEQLYNPAQVDVMQRAQAPVSNHDYTVAAMPASVV